MSTTPSRRQRCAVYTRVSTDERLDQSFNSIDAQRDAGQAYLASHRAEGWIPVAEDYDDGGFSGGTMERPALKRLLADIEAGQVNLIIVYKIDRLTRSLTDFARMVEVFERHGVSFVAVTQPLNTTTSMGRLMLNILLSFAQFERENGAERVRDKIAASKRKGMWMGGVPPLGYDVVDRKLVVNEPEAETVRQLFRRFAAVGSATTLVKALHREGVRSKVWTSRSGRAHPGKLMDKGGLYKVLNNRIYLGEISHKGAWYPGEHDGIVDSAEWAAVQDLLRRPVQQRQRQREAATPFLLKGLVFGADGSAMTPWFTTKGNGRRYRYYLPMREAKEHAGASGLPRLPAAELEALVLEQMRVVLKSPEVLAAMIPAAIAADPTLDEAQVTVAMRQLDAIWEQLFPAEQARIAQLLIQRVTVAPDQVEVHFHACGLQQMTQELTPSRSARRRA